MKLENVEFLKEYGERMRDLAGYVNVLIRNGLIDSYDCDYRVMNSFQFLVNGTSHLYNDIEELLKNDAEAGGDNERRFYNHHYAANPGRIYKDLREFQHTFAIMYKNENEALSAKHLEYIQPCYNEVECFYNDFTKKLDPIIPQVGDSFDPIYHKQKENSYETHNVVSEVVKQGKMFEGNVIDKAEVIR